MDEMNWADLQMFLSVARGGGLAGGAAQSRQSAPTLGRHMLKLEQALGEPLFVRLPRGYELTVAGQSLLAEVQELDTRFSNIQSKIGRAGERMPITISAGTWMARFLAGHFEELDTSNARLMFQAADAQQSITRREATIALRNGRPKEPGAAGRKSVRVTFAPYVGAQANPHQDWVASTSNTPSANWVRQHQEANIRLTVSSPRSLLDFALEGAGQVLLPCFVGDAEAGLARSGEIVEALSHDQWLVVHEADRNLPHVRQVVDSIWKILKQHRPAFEGKRR